MKKFVLIGLVFLSSVVFASSSHVQCYSKNKLIFDKWVKDENIVLFDSYVLVYDQRQSYLMDADCIISSKIKKNR